MQPFLTLLAICIVTIIAPSRRFHVVAQVIKTKFAVGAVGDVAFVSFAPLNWIHIALYEPSS